MATELFRDKVEGPDGDKITVSAMTNGERSIVTVTAQRGGYGMTFSIPPDVARDLATTMLVAADKAEKRQ